MSVLVRKVTPKLIHEFVEFSKSEYVSGPTVSYESVKWRHLDSPGGPSTSVELHNSDQQIGRILVQTNVWIFGTQELRAASPIELLIHPHFRKTQIFISLFNSGMKTALSESDFVLHTSNPQTDDLYRKLLKLTPITELDGALFPLRPFNLLTTKIRIRVPILEKIGDAIYKKLIVLLTTLLRGDLAFIDPPDAAIQEEIIERFHQSQTFASRRSAADREWRYLGAGVFHYQTQWFKVGNLPVGYLVWSDREINGIKGRFVIDIVCGEKLSRYALLMMWSRTIKLAVTNDTDALFFFFNSKCVSLKHLSHFPLFKVKRSMLPQQIPIFVRSNKNLLQNDFSARISTGYFVLSDLDIF